MIKYLIPFLFILFTPLKIETAIPLGPPCVAPEIIKYAHKYHHINFSEEDKNHHWFFIRDGKKCSLFTKAFLKWYGRGK